MPASRPNEPPGATAGLPDTARSRLPCSFASRRTFRRSRSSAGRGTRAVSHRVCEGEILSRISFSTALTVFHKAVGRSSSFHSLTSARLDSANVGKLGFRPNYMKSACHDATATRSGVSHRIPNVRNSGESPLKRTRGDDLCRAPWTTRHGRRMTDTTHNRRGFHSLI
jgi:hypothetical protein